MNTRTSLIVAGLITLAALVYSGYMWTQLPAIVPTHWNAANQVDAYGSKLTPVLLMPIFMVCMAGLILVLPAISPRKFEVDAFRSTFNYVMLLVIGLFGALHVMILQATLRGSFPFDRAFGVVFFLFFALMGNVLGKVRRNFWMGIRTPWTIADERVWDRTHRLAARMWTVGGAIGVILALAGVPFMFWMIYLIVLTTWPVVMSFFIYQRLNRGGSLAS